MKSLQQFSKRLQHTAKCLNGNHDWEELPFPTNKDYEQKSPGKICLWCGKFISSEKKDKPKVSREERATVLYDKVLQRKHETENAGRGYHVLRCPGPYDEHLEPLIPDD